VGPDQRLDATPRGRRGPLHTVTSPASPSSSSAPATKPDASSPSIQIDRRPHPRHGRHDVAHPRSAESTLDRKESRKSSPRKPSSATASPRYFRDQAPPDQEDGLNGVDLKMMPAVGPFRRSPAGPQRKRRRKAIRSSRSHSSIHDPIDAAHENQSRKPAEAACAAGSGAPRSGRKPAPPPIRPQMAKMSKQMGRGGLAQKHDAGRPSGAMAWRQTKVRPIELARCGSRRSSHGTFWYQGAMSMLIQSCRK